MTTETIDAPAFLLLGPDGPAREAPRLTHADWFSGIGGFALAFERAGFTTVSFSEIEPFALRVLGTHWPDVPQLGDIIRLGTGGGDAIGDPDEDAGGEAGRREGATDLGGEELHGLPETGPDAVPADGGPLDLLPADGPRPSWADALVWTGGTPCQDFSIAGRRAGLHNPDGSLTRSGLALVWLDLIEEHKPRWIIWENVPGLLSSNQGRDLEALLGSLVELGYGVAYRVLDAQDFGVPQRRRRIFIAAALGDPDAIGPRAVLALGEGGEGDPLAGIASGEEPSRASRDGSRVLGFDIAGPLTKRYAKGINTTIDDGAVVVHRPEVDPGGMREAPGLPGWLDGAEGPVGTIDGSDGGMDENDAEQGRVLAYRKVHRAMSTEDHETWDEAAASNTLNVFDTGERDTHAVLFKARGDPRSSTQPYAVTSEDRHAVFQQHGSAVGPLGTVKGRSAQNGVGFMVAPADFSEDHLLPKGMDSPRYKVLGNAVAVPVVEWIARRLRAYLEATQ